MGVRVSARIEERSFLIMGALSGCGVGAIGAPVVPAGGGERSVWGEPQAGGSENRWGRPGAFARRVSRSGDATTWKGGNRKGCGWCTSAPPGTGNLIPGLSGGHSESSVGGIRADEAVRVVEHAVYPVAYSTASSGSSSARSCGLMGLAAGNSRKEPLFPESASPASAGSSLSHEETVSKADGGAAKDGWGSWAFPLLNVPWPLRRRRRWRGDDDVVR